MNGVDEQTFASTDNSDEVVKNFRRASVDAAMLNLDAVNVDVANSHTDLSFSNYQLKHSDEDAHYVTSPKERLYYLCTFYDYNKNVYGLDSSQQPPNVGAHGLIATMRQHFPPALATYVKRNFFDVDESSGDNKYKFFASPNPQMEKDSFMCSFTCWAQSEHIMALQTLNSLREAMDDKPFLSKSGVAIPGVKSFQSMLDYTDKASFDAAHQSQSQRGVLQHQGTMSLPTAAHKPSHE